MAAPVRFTGVGKRFRRGESATALRDAIGRLFGRRADRGEFWALRGISFTVAEGEALGIVGRNGAGKSTVLKLAAGLLRPNEGTVHVEGPLSALIEVGAGFHPDLTGRENIQLYGSVLGLSRKILRERTDEIVDFAEIREFIDTPVKRYSSGMYMRLGFSVAVHVDPRVLLVDEVLAVGDLGFRQKCMRRVRDLKARGRTILFVSHRMSDIRGICDRVLQISGGTVAREGDALTVSREFEKEMSGKSLAELRGEAASHRPGDSPVRIVTAEPRVAGARAVEIASGDGLDVVAEAEFATKVPAPVLSVSILRADQTRICVAHTRRLGIDLPDVEGQLSFAVRFPRLDLREDHYAVEVAIWDRELMTPLAQFITTEFFVTDPRPPINRPGAWEAEARFLEIRVGKDR
jgi:ABC-type polysaccharide/polyol phosphate transport system ATPase subunit